MYLHMYLYNFNELWKILCYMWHDPLSTNRSEFQQYCYRLNKTNYTSLADWTPAVML